MSKQVARITGNGRSYDVEANIAFHFYDYDLSDEEIAAIQDRILALDRENPWTDEPNVITKKVPASIAHIYHNTVRHNWHVPETVLWFTIKPGATFMREGQVHAYERYLDNLAKRLAHSGPVLVSEMPVVFREVHTVVELKRLAFFKAA